MRRVLADIELRVWLTAAALLLSVLAFWEQVSAAITSAACLERAKYELISCLAPPSDWQLALSGATVLGLAMATGTFLAQPRRRPG